MTISSPKFFMLSRPFNISRKVFANSLSIGVHETRALFGCDVEIVHVHRESDTKTQNQLVSGYRAVVDEDYAPALGVDVHFVNIFRSPTLELRTESTLESVSTD